MFAEKKPSSGKALLCSVRTEEECLGMDCYTFLQPGGQGFFSPLSAVLYDGILKPEETTMLHTRYRTSPVSNDTPLKLKEAKLNFHFH